MFVLLLFVMFFGVEAQSASSSSQLPSQSPAPVISPALAVIVGVFLAVTLLMVFIVLFVARFYSRAIPVHNQQIQDEVVFERSRFSGVDKKVIESLPFFKFSLLKGSREGLECAVCLSKFEDIEVLRLLPKCKHAFHIACIDQWLEKHSSCPLCRHKVSINDLSHVTYSTSLRFLSNQSAQPEDSNLELLVQREEDHQGSLRYNVGRSFRKFYKIKKEELLIKQNQKDLHKHKHTIIASNVVLKNRWSNLSSSDLLFLKEMLNAMSSNRFSGSDSLGVMEAGKITSIKEELEWKSALESKFNKIHTTSESEPHSTHASTILNPTQGRSMSEISTHPRSIEFTTENKSQETFARNNMEEERMSRLWLPIAQRTVQLFGNREKELPTVSQYKIDIQSNT